MLTNASASILFVYTFWLVHEIGSLFTDSSPTPSPPLYTLLLLLLNPFPPPPPPPSLLNTFLSLGHASGSRKCRAPGKSRWPSSGGGEVVEECDEVMVVECGDAAAAVVMVCAAAVGVMAEYCRTVV